MRSLTIIRLVVWEGQVYGAVWVLTWWVSPCWGVLVSPFILLTLIDTLTSRLDGEEGFGRPWACMGCVMSVSIITITMRPKS